MTYKFSNVKITQSIGALNPFVEPTNLIKSSIITDDFVLRMADKHIVVCPERIVIGHRSRNIFFVAPSATIESKIKDFQLWLKLDDLNKPRDGFREAFMASSESSHSYSRLSNVWYSREDNIFWTFNEQLATKLVRILRPQLGWYR